jgi:hypothetical protein
MPHAVAINLPSDRTPLFLNANVATAIILFPLFWSSLAFSDIRHSQLLSFVVQCCAKDDTERLINPNMLNVTVKQ